MHWLTAKLIIEPTFYFIYFYQLLALWTDTYNYYWFSALILLFNRLSVKPITNENVYVFNVHASVCLNGGECSIDIPILRNTRLPTIRAIITGETKSKQLYINITLPSNCFSSEGMNVCCNLFCLLKFSDNLCFTKY